MTEPTRTREQAHVGIVGGEDIVVSIARKQEGQRDYCTKVIPLDEGTFDAVGRYVPDLLIVDASLDGATDFVERWMTDGGEALVIALAPAFEPARIGRLTALGVARILPRVVSSSVLRRACEDVLDQRDGRTERFSLGRKPTVEQIADRLAAEVRRALVDDAVGGAASTRIAVADGAEVMGAMWGAIARVQEVIRARSGGAIQYRGDAPEGAIAIAPHLHPPVARDASPVAERRGGGADASRVELFGRAVVVADDDPAVTWFLADLLRTAGCRVTEALDGKTALKAVFESAPDLVMSDVLMPGLDGFSLCRAIKRDVLLRDTPVMLLSWKEDLLVRVRELGASAEAYLAKASDAKVLLTRAREALNGRVAIEQRMAKGGEVHGRLDGISVATLLRLAGRNVASSRLTLRELDWTYVIELRGGSVVRATAAQERGKTLRGHAALGRALGARAGRFSVIATDAAIPRDFEGAIDDVLAPSVTLARALLEGTTGPDADRVARVRLAPGEELSALRRSLHPDLRRVLDLLAEGEAPSQLLAREDLEPRWVEDVLSNLASRALIESLRDAEGKDVLTAPVSQLFEAPADEDNELISAETDEAHDVVAHDDAALVSTAIADDAHLPLEAEAVVAEGQPVEAEVPSQAAFEVALAALEIGPALSSNPSSGGLDAVAELRAEPSAGSKESWGDEPGLEVLEDQSEAPPPAAVRDSEWPMRSEEGTPATGLHALSAAQVDVDTQTADEPPAPLPGARPELEQTSFEGTYDLSGIPADAEIVDAPPHVEPSIDADVRPAALLPEELSTSDLLPEGDLSDIVLPNAAAEPPPPAFPPASHTQELPTLALRMPPRTAPSVPEVAPNVMAPVLAPMASDASAPLESSHSAREHDAPVPTVEESSPRHVETVRLVKPQAPVPVPESNTGTNTQPYRAAGETLSPLVSEERPAPVPPAAPEALSTSSLAAALGLSSKPDLAAVPALSSKPDLAPVPALSSGTDPVTDPRPAALRTSLDEVTDVRGLGSKRPADPPPMFVLPPSAPPKAKAEDRTPAPTEAKAAKDGGASWKMPWGMLAAAAAVGLLIGGIGKQVFPRAQSKAAPSAVRPVAAASATQAAVAPLPAPAASSAAPALPPVVEPKPSVTGPKRPEPEIRYEDSIPGQKMPKRNGIIEANVPKDEPIRINGKVAGKGHLLVQQKPGNYEISIGQGDEVRFVVEVRSGKAVRITLKAPENPDKP
jgi:CheY-like chemotaxis protein